MVRPYYERTGHSSLEENVARHGDFDVGHLVVGVVRRDRFGRCPRAGKRYLACVVVQIVICTKGLGDTVDQDGVGAKNKRRVAHRKSGGLAVAGADGLRSRRV